MSVSESFSKRLKELRERNHMSQNQLAAALGISRGSISFYENGERTPDIEVLDRVAAEFDVSVDFLLGYAQSEKRDDVAIEYDTGLERETIEVFRKIKKQLDEFNNDDYDHPEYAKELFAEQLKVMNEFIQNSRFEDICAEIAEYRMDAKVDPLQMSIIMYIDKATAPSPLFDLGIRDLEEDAWRNGDRPSLQQWLINCGIHIPDKKLNALSDFMDTFLCCIKSYENYTNQYMYTSSIFSEASGATLDIEDDAVDLIRDLTTRRYRAAVHCSEFPVKEQSDMGVALSRLEKLIRKEKN